MSNNTVRIGIVGAGANTRSRHIPGLRACDNVEIVSVVNLAEAQQMHAASRRHPELVTQIVPSPFTLHADRTVRRMIDDGELGRVLAIDVRRTTGTFLDPDAPMTWRQDVELSGLNIMMMGICYESVLRWVGDARQVAAMGKVFVEQRKDGETGKRRDVSIPEHLTIIADMANGAQMTMSFSSVTGAVEHNEFVVYGSDATLKLEGDKLLLARRSDGEFREVDIPEHERGGWRVEEEFINAIRGKEEISHTTFEDGVRHMAFTEAVSRSMSDGRAVDVEF